MNKKTLLSLAGVGLTIASFFIGNAKDDIDKKEMEARQDERCREYIQQEVKTQMSMLDVINGKES